jgi:hypothetical protein
MQVEGNLQSGFVLAAILAAVLLVSRIGGTDELLRRIYQVALGVIIVFTAFAGTTAFIRPPDIDASALSGSFDDEASADFLEDTARRDAVATTVHAGIGVVALLLGLLSYRRMTVLPLAVALGGLLLLLFGGSTTAPSAPSDPFGGLFGIFGSVLGAVAGVSQTVDVVHFIVLLSGGIALLAFGYTEWEEESLRRTGPPADTGGDAAA